MSVNCSGSPAPREAILLMQGSTNKILADVTDPLHPRTMCTLTGAWSPELATQTLISWSATQGAAGSPGSSLIVTLDVSTGATGVVASWTGGGLMDGLHGWSPDHGSLAYVTSDATAVNLHLLSGGGDHIVAVFGAVPGRGANPDEDDAYLDFSADGQYFAFVQTYTSSGAQLQVRKTSDGTLAYSQANGTMATWSSTGSTLYFRQTAGTMIDSWDPTAGAAQAIGQPLAWIRPRADSGDDYLAFTVRDSGGSPHVWLYGHSGRAGGELPNVRSSAAWLTTTTVFLVEEASCGSTCGPGPPTQPDGHTFTYDTGTQVETASAIGQVLATWPRPGQ